VSTHIGAKVGDIAPTVLKITGYDDEQLKSCNFDGRPLF